MNRVPDVVTIEEDGPEKPAPGTDVIVEDDGEEALPEGLTEEGGNYRLALRRPIKLVFTSTSGTTREEMFDALPMRRLTGGDMRAMMTSGRADGSLLLLERAVTLPASRVVKVLDKLDAGDLMRAMGVIGFLSGGSRPTGR